MSNPTVLETPRTDQPEFSRVHYHSTTQEPFSKYSFRDVSFQSVQPLHGRILWIYKYIRDCGGHDLRRQYLRCRSDAWVVQHEETRMLRIASRKCNQRWCPLCQRTKRWVITHSVGDWVSKAKYPKFLTVTLRSSDHPLELQIARLYDAFAKLRTSVFFRRRIKGGVWFFQLTINKQTQQWHPHIHCLIDGDYISKRQLVTKWKALTFDSHIVDIRKVSDPEKAAEYVARYATVPGDILKCTVPQGAAMVIGLKGRRMCGSFGSAKGLCLRVRQGDDHSKWRKVMSYTALAIGSVYDEFIMYLKDCILANNPVQADVWGLYDSPDMPAVCLNTKPESVHQLWFEFSDHWFVSGGFV